MLEHISDSDEVMVKINEALDDPDLYRVVISNRLRKKVLKMGLDKCKKLGIEVNRKLPGCVLAFFFTRELQNFKISSFDEVGSKFAMDFASEPNWKLFDNYP